MSSAICFNLDWPKILSSGNGLNHLCPIIVQVTDERYYNNDTNVFTMYTYISKSRATGRLTHYSDVKF